MKKITLKNRKHIKLKKVSKINELLTALLVLSGVTIIMLGSLRLSGFALLDYNITSTTNNNLIIAMIALFLIAGLLKLYTLKNP